MKCIGYAGQRFLLPSPFHIKGDTFLSKPGMPVDIDLTIKHEENTNNVENISLEAA